MITVAQIAEIIKGEIIGDPELPLSGVCDLENGLEGHITFIANPSYYRYFNSSAASAVIVSRDFNLTPDGKTLIKVANPRLGFAETLSIFNERPENSRGISDKANISDTAILGENVSIQPGASIEANVTIGDHSFIGSGAFIGNGAVIGENTIIHANVTVYDMVRIGSRVEIDSGTVIGADGFGWIPDKATHHKIPQIGSVFIEDDVSIGANCCLDRGTFGHTIIGAMTKMDNLIQIGHNVKIGKGCFIVSQVGIGGSTEVGDYVTLAGQVGVVDHIKIGERTVVASKSAVTSSLEPGSFVSGIPARNHKSRLRQDVVVSQLPELLKRIRHLESKVKNLKKD